MTRHGKNCTAGAVYTYHEKKKDTAASGYGTQSIRLGKDAIKDFDCCCLSLQPCQDPVITPDGYMYDKQAILEYILHQKTEIAKKMKLYEKQKKEQKSTSNLESKSGERETVQRFKTMENSIVSKPINPFVSGQKKGSEVAKPASSSAESSSGSSASSSSQSLPSFWIPSLTPEAKPTLLKKPSKTVLCPMSGRPIKMNELIDVRFTPVDPSLARVALLTRQDRYVCAVTRDVLANSIPCAVLRPSGAVVTMECVEKLIKKDMMDPMTGDKLSDRDIIPLQRGGTGFAGSGVALRAKEARPVMQV
ncbi:nitric oxide synthase-interacting protein [Cynoglossus semilaevis]|uniref:Nitric oxide synthase-interacting protein n=1 Tax=Cynoglossus semilaevis TaxID=244447 RepID=A0A3P8VW41_CYNSE|nr:nitric oxide synthase-interacting protein [Cynoglossus semilaevis]XP_008328712.1 nitric oxide synthase-interacting protein [Cynoglossus semilaevis]XP_008328713.1 nitric oxide synthase-interacting protein [Cynoglossus semilaevis]XP_024920504.1 nitric oxide synthase-interacting protein [Cynoglossus semilaevis]